MEKGKKVLGVDVDGCIHYYGKSWEGGLLYDVPVDGVQKGLQNLMDLGYYILIYSTRTNPDFKTPGEPDQYSQLEEYLKKHNIPYHEIYKGNGKPKCYAFIDDRSISFKGDWNQTIEDIKSFKVWNKSKDYISSSEIINKSE